MAPAFAPAVLPLFAPPTGPPTPCAAANVRPASRTLNDHALIHESQRISDGDVENR